MQSWTLEQLRTATEAGGVSAVRLQAEGGGFYVRITTKNNAEAILSHARSDEPRTFPNPLPAITLLRKLGLMVGTFDISNWNPELKPLARTRPDRAAAMKNANEAVEHDRWFRAQVEQGLAEADDPATQWISQEQARASWTEKRANLLRQVKRGK